MTKASSTGLKQTHGGNKAAGEKPGANSALRTASKKPASKKNPGAVTIDAKKAQPAQKATRVESPGKYSLRLNEQKAVVY